MSIRFRLKTLAPVIVAGTLLLGACDSGSPTITPATGVPQGNPTAPTAAQTGEVPAAVPSTVPATQATPAGSGGSGGAPTATAAAVEDDAPLQLGPITIETNDATRVGAFESERGLNVPQGFHVQVYATGLSGVRWLGLGPDGMVYVTVREEGRVVTLPDRDGDGTADSADTFAENLGSVHGIAFKDNAVYVANEGQIIRLEDTDKDGKADKQDVIAGDLPTGGGHSTRTLAFGTDGKLYVSAGSSCNVCKESNEKRAAISRYSADGTFEKVFASGLRNAVGLIVHPETGELWATNNGRDSIGDDIPPETIYNVKEDVNYGWPYCYGHQVEDTDFGGAPQGFCGTTGVPAVEMQAHSAPLGLAFYTGDQFPASYKGDLIVAFHGSWNRSEPTGYKVVRVRFKDNQPDASVGDLQVEDFITGWRVRGDVWGRPVDPMVAPDGSLLLTDDATGTIYRVYYEVNAGP